MASKKRNTLEVTPVLSGTDVVGLSISGVIPFGDFAAEREGSEYQIPMRARDSEGVALTDEDGAALFVTVDGENQPMDESIERVDLPKFYKMENQKASAHRDFRKTVTPIDVVWPDGKVRDLKITIKANNGLTPKEYSEQQKNAASKRAATTGKNLSNERLEQQLQVLQAEAAKRGIKIPA